jgi:hypothetical protein
VIKQSIYAKKEWKNEWLWKRHVYTIDKIDKNGKQIEN